MENIFFKLMGQKTSGKLVLIAVVKEDFFGEIPTIFECQAIKTPATIYSGIYPTLRINSDTIEDVTEKFKGFGIAGILTENNWYCAKREQEDLFNIQIK